MYLFDNSTITFGNSCNVSYNNNIALQHGAAIYFALQSTATFEENLLLTLHTNKAIISGGALYSLNNIPIQL